VSRVGLMLYTVRDECARDFEGTLRAVAGLGYEGVELFDLHGYDAAEVRTWLDELGLAVAGRHASLTALGSDLDQLAEDAELLGSNRVVLSWIDPPSSAADARSIVELLTRSAEEVAACGLELGFHNHWGELEVLDDGRRLFDDLLEVPIFFELDLGWAWWAGVDPVELLDLAAGRIPLVHVKDFPARGERTFCPVGDGNVGYERVAPAAVARGVEWLLVEQDETDGSSLDAAARSFHALTGMLDAS
jgi:sugar phosphate isomerase/epimerase